MTRTCSFRARTCTRRCSCKSRTTSCCAPGSWCRCMSRESTCRSPRIDIWDGKEGWARVDEGDREGDGKEIGGSGERGSDTVGGRARARKRGQLGPMTSAQQLTRKTRCRSSCRSKTKRKQAWAWHRVCRELMCGAATVRPTQTLLISLRL